MKILCRIVSCIMFIVMVISLSACSNDDNTDREPLSYRIIERNGEYFIKISGDPLSYYERELACKAAGLYFESISEMITEVTEYKLDEQKIYDMWIQFYSDENDEKPILNIYDPYVPVFPDGLKYSDIAWFGTYYQVSLTDLNGSSGKGIFMYCSDEIYDLWAGYKIEKRFADDSLEGTHSDDRNSEVYIYNSPDGKQYKYICYTVISKYDSTELYVQEDYLLKSPNSYDHISEEIPRQIYVFSTSQSEKYFALTSGLEERPSAEWLSSFGLQKYSES